VQIGEDGRIKKPPKRADFGSRDFTRYDHPSAQAGGGVVVVVVVKLHSGFCMGIALKVGIISFFPRSEGMDFEYVSTRVMVEKRITRIYNLL
jgi:hypothetical protein